ncbi:MAG: HAD family hydrolase [Desulfomonilia bacterium]
MDGTLLDTLNDIADSMNAVLRLSGFPTHSLEEYRGLVGDGIEVLVERSLPEEWRTGQYIEQCVNAMRNEYAQRWSATTHPFEGIPALLDELSRRDIQMAILSNKLESFTQIMASTMLGSWTFREVVGLRSDVPRKPDPTGAFGITRSLNVLPKRCIFLGDSGVDMLTGVRAGMHPVGVLWGYQEREALIRAGAQVLIETPGELLDILGG